MHSRFFLFAALALMGCSASPRAARQVASYGDVQSYEEHVGRMRYADLDGGQMAYIDEGQGDPIVLIHGIPTSSWMYRKVIAGLVEQGRRVIAPDLMGMGASQRLTSAPDLRVKSQAGYLLELLGEHLGLQDWTHVVHDFGGPISWEMLGIHAFAPRACCSWTPSHSNRVGTPSSMG